MALIGSLLVSLCATVLLLPEFFPPTGIFLPFIGLCNILDDFAIGFDGPVVEYSYETLAPDFDSKSGRPIIFFYWDEVRSCDRLK